MSIRFSLSLLALALAFLMTSALSAEEMSKYSVNLATNNTLGVYLVNQTGFTLYYFMKDDPGNGTSSCYENCSKIWPPFSVENLTVALGLKAADFTVINRKDDIKQIAYKGWPLYLYSKDIKPKDAYGQSANEVWFVVDPTSPTFRKPTPSILKLKLDSLPLREAEHSCISCSRNPPGAKEFYY